MHWFSYPPFHFFKLTGAFWKMGSFTADVCNKDLYDLKILEAIDYTKSVGKKKSISKTLVLH